MQRVLLIAGAAVVSLLLAYFIVLQFDFGASESDAVPATPEAPNSKLIDDLISNSEMFDVIQREFPEGFSDVLNEVERAVPRGDQAVQAAAAVSVGSIRIANAPFLQAATPETLLDVVEENIRTHELVREQLGDLACASFGVSGPPALGDLSLHPEIITQLDRQGATLFRAMASGRNRQMRQPANDAVWASIIRFDSLAPEQQEKVQLFGRQEADNPDYCDALLWFMNRISTAEGEDADRARAAFAMQLAKG